MIDFIALKMHLSPTERENLLDELHDEKLFTSCRTFGILSFLYIVPGTIVRDDFSFRIRQYRRIFGTAISARK